MTIAVGDCIPSCTLSVMGSEGPAPVSTADLFNNNKILMFAVPGAFTPGCSMTHLPGYVANADKIKEMGVDGIICLSVNDVFVMHAWGEAQNSNDSIVMLADGNGEYKHFTTRNRGFFSWGNRRHRRRISRCAGVKSLHRSGGA